MTEQKDRREQVFGTTDEQAIEWLMRVRQLRADGMSPIEAIEQANREQEEDAR